MRPRSAPFESEAVHDLHRRWEDAAKAVLKGEDPRTSLVSRSWDGFDIGPLYRRADNPAAVIQTAARPWRVSQRVDHADESWAAKQALVDLENGADALALVVQGSRPARGFGVEASAESLDRILGCVDFSLIALRADAGGSALAVAQSLFEIADRRGHAGVDLDWDLGLDPIGTMAVTGCRCSTWGDIDNQLAPVVEAFAERSINGSLLLADGRCYHEAGATEAQELAAVLATGTAYMRALARLGHDPASTRGMIAFLLCADADQFLTTAKFRALRRLWHNVEELCGLDRLPIRLHAETAWRMCTERDPWINIVRSTIATFAAGIGGADVVTVLPFTAVHGLPDAFARRIARNLQLVLLEESNAWRVSDPSHGSGAFESLTDALVEEAWGQFQLIEREGGIFSSLCAGRLQSRIAKIRLDRKVAVETRRVPITGTSEFPNLNEGKISILIPAPDCVPIVKWPSCTSGNEPLPTFRVSEDYEKYRRLSDVHFAETGSRKKVALFSAGPVAQRSSGINFLRNMFESVGIEISDLDFDSDNNIASLPGCVCLHIADGTHMNIAKQLVNSIRYMNFSTILFYGDTSHIKIELDSISKVSVIGNNFNVIAMAREIYAD